MSSPKSTNPLARWRAAPKMLRALLIVPVLLSGCASTPVATVEPFRTAMRDVCVSRDDALTERTAQQVEANNLALRKLLSRGSQCPKPTGKPQSKAETPTS